MNGNHMIWLWKKYIINNNITVASAIFKPSAIINPAYDNNGLREERLKINTAIIEGMA